MKGASASSSLARFAAPRSISYVAPSRLNETVSASSEPSRSSVMTTDTLLDMAPIVGLSAGGCQRTAPLVELEIAVRDFAAFTRLATMTPQRISQMLSSGRLHGPPVGSGRAPKGADRVWRDEIDRVIRERETGTRRGRRPKGSIDQQGSRTAREAFVLEAALRMKIGLDEARRLLKEERQTRKRVVSMLADAVAEIARAQAGADSLDRIAEAYSEALTQLLTPDQPGE
jgi:hypothetical protein